jgi:hypothetical protein
MWNRKRTRQRRAGILILLLGIGAAVSAEATITWHFGTAADVFAACAASCFVLCVPLLLEPVGNTPTIDVDCRSKEAAEACRIPGPDECLIGWIIDNVGGEMDAGEIGGDFAGDGLDCDYDLPFL